LNTFWLGFLTELRNYLEGYGCGVFEGAVLEFALRDGENHDKPWLLLITQLRFEAGTSKIYRLRSL
jgi:hypothetical protein